MLCVKEREKREREREKRERREERKKEERERAEDHGITKRVKKKLLHRRPCIRRHYTYSAIQHYIFDCYSPTYPHPQYFSFIKCARSTEVRDCGEGGL